MVAVQAYWICLSIATAPPRTHARWLTLDGGSEEYKNHDVYQVLAYCTATGEGPMSILHKLTDEEMNRCR